MHAFLMLLSLKDYDDHNPQHKLAVLMFLEAAVKLHYHMLLLYQINASLQALVNGVLDSSAGQVRPTRCDSSFFSARLSPSLFPI